MKSPKHISNLVYLVGNNIFGAEDNSIIIGSLSITRGVTIPIIKNMPSTIYVHLQDYINGPEDVAVHVNIMEVYLTDNPPIIELLVDFLLPVPALLMH